MERYPKPWSVQRTYAAKHQNDPYAPGKQVRFNQKVLLCRVPSSNSYDAEEKRDIWIQPVELRKIRQELKQTINLAARRRLLGDTEKHCLRGIEIAVPAVLRTRMLRRRKLTTAVLQEHHFQKTMGIRDPERLRRVSRQYSRKSSLQSLSKGLKDALAVYLLNMEETENKLRECHAKGIFQPAESSNPQPKSPSTASKSPPVTLLHHTKRILAGKIRHIEQALSPVKFTIDGVYSQKHGTKKNSTPRERQTKAILWPSSKFYEVVV